MNSKFFKMSLLAVLTVLLGSCGDDGGSGNSGSDDTSVVCSTGALRCEGFQLQSCKNNQWTKKEDCANGCDPVSKSCKDDGSKPDDPDEQNCTADDLRCDGNQLQICKDNAWTKKEDCDNGCDEASHSCNAKPGDPAQCTEDALRCDSNQLQVCKGNVWTKKEDCPNGCDSSTNACKTPVNPGPNLICDEGAKKCDGDFIVECINDKWKKADTACEKGCKLGVCKTQVTDPSDPSDLISCDDAGCISITDYTACSATCKSMGLGYCYMSLSENSYSCSAVQKEATGSISSVYPPEDLVTCESIGCQIDNKVCTDICKGAGMNYCYVSISEQSIVCNGKQLEATGKIDTPSAETYPPEDLVDCDAAGCMDSAENIACSASCKAKGQNYCYVVISENIYACSSTQQEATGKIDTPPATSYPPEDLVDCDTVGCMDSADNIACSASCKAKGQNYCYVVISENTYTCSSTQQEATGTPSTPPATTYPPEDLVSCEDAFCQLSAETSCLDDCKLKGANYCYMILSENKYTCSMTEQAATGVKYLPSDLVACNASCQTGSKSCSQVCQEYGKNYCYIIIAEKGVPATEVGFVCSNTQHEATGNN